MKNGKLGAAVIACGEGFRHIKAYKDSPRYELLALCDIHPERIRKRIDECGLNPDIFRCQDYRELLAIPEIDVVSVTSPDYFHAEHSIAALEAGKNVLCEKPMTLDLEESKAIVAAVRRTGKAFMIGHPTRYTPAFILARRMIQNGDIGELFMVESEYAHNYRAAMGIDNWRVDVRRDPFLGGACHAMDLIRWVTDDLVDEAFAYGTKKGLADWPIACDSYMAVFKFRNGVIGKVMCSIGLSRPYTMRSVFYGTKGTIICDNISKTLQISSVKLFGSEGELCTPFAEVPVEVNNHNVETQVDRMADILLKGAENHAGATEGARTVAACAAAIESARTGKPVKVEQNF